MRKAVLLLLVLILLPVCGTTPAADLTPAGQEAPWLSAGLLLPLREWEQPEPGLSGTAESTAEAQVEALLTAMCLEEKVGQMFLARCPEENAAEKAARYHLGGYILFGRDFKDKTPKQVRTDIRAYQAAAAIPLLIGVDEEGGTVCRVSAHSQFRGQRFLSPGAVFAEGGWAGIAADTVEKCTLLASLGVNLNLAPVCDVPADPSDFIYPRAFGTDAGQVSDYVRLVTRIMEKQSMGSVLKHFPGYGDNADTHTGAAVDERPYETFENVDFLPFEAGIQAGADCVLVSHNTVCCMDDTAPASLSPEVHKILRETLHFTGVILTDDLAMEAVKLYAGDASVAVAAVLAGNDMLCSSSFEGQIPAVIAAVEDGTIPETIINGAVARILYWKLELGLLPEGER